MPSTTIPQGLEDLLNAKVASLTTSRSGRCASGDLGLVCLQARLVPLPAIPQRRSTEGKESPCPAEGQPADLRSSRSVPLLDVRGTARTESDDGCAWADAFITPKYGADVREFPGANRLVITIEPDNILSQNGAG